MNLNISGRHLEVTPALRDYVSTKLERILRHFDQVVDVRVTLSILNEKEKERRQHAECNMLVKGDELHVESSQHDMYAAIDDLMDKLDRQVGRYKEKLQDYQAQAQKRMEHV
ncbi:MAG: ribosome-associated translation inhibitor RaiA [Brachymonas sp.]|uniref:ribosome hibernation-promoting factor, HPF/YfiA family n=1 Tax=unclassified Brachymonas TaxID=2621329 RepID=UPI0035AE572D